MCVGPSAADEPTKTEQKVACGALAEQTCAALVSHLLAGFGSSQLEHRQAICEQKLQEFRQILAETERFVTALNPTLTASRRSIRLQWALGRCLGLEHAIQAVGPHCKGDMARAAEQQQCQVRGCQDKIRLLLSKPTPDDGDAELLRSCPQTQDSKGRLMALLGIASSRVCQFRTEKEKIKTKDTKVPAFDGINLDCALGA